jgi:hypothetical protein
MAPEQDKADPDTAADVTAEVESGLRTLERYLARHADFDRWCADHVRRYGREPGAGEDRPAAAG